MKNSRFYITNFIFLFLLISFCLEGCGSIFNGSNHENSLELAKAYGYADSVTIDSVDSSGVTYKFTLIPNKDYDEGSFTVYWDNEDYLYVSVYTTYFSYFTNETKSGQEFEINFSDNPTIYINLKTRLSYRSQGYVTLTVFSDSGHRVDLKEVTSSTGTTSTDGITVSSYSVGSKVYDKNNKTVAIVAGQEVDGTWFAVGLERSSDSMVWLDETSSDSTYFSEIATHINSDGTYTGDTDGSDNWDVIKSQDSTRANSGKYLAFEWANSYSSSYASTVSGWYLPTLYEYYTMWKNMTTIDNQIAASFGDVLSGYTYWSSSQDSERTYSDAGDFYFGSSFDSDMSSWKNATYNYCRAIIKLTSSSSSSSDTSTDTDTTTDTKKWKEVDISTSNSGKGLKFNTTTSNTYYVYMDDAGEGSGKYTLDALISVYYYDEDLGETSYYHYQVDKCYYSPLYIYAYETEATIDLRGVNKNDTGKFAVAVTDAYGNNVELYYAYSSSY